MKLWVKAQNRLRKLLPQEVQDVLDKNEKAGTTESKEYQDAVAVFYAHYLCILDPMPEAIANGFGEIANDPTVYLTMTLAQWTIVEDAHKISVPTLMINRRLDEAQDDVVAPFFREIPRVKWIKLANSSHMAHYNYEERERFMEEVRKFLNF